MNDKRVYIEKYTQNAGLYIYTGMQKAWENIGYEVELYSENLPLLDDSNIMLYEHNLENLECIELLSTYKKVFLFVLATSMPKHWGSHPNFVSLNPHRKEINKIPNIVKWTFCKADNEYFNGWDGEIKHIPLAFDNLTYQKIEDPAYAYDVCYIGTWADNGFNEKKKRLISYLGEFKKSGLKCGFFINKGLTLEQEAKVLYNSKICLNIHDQYQIELGLDTNERTWKGLGLTGCVVSDRVKVLDEYNLLGLQQVDTPEEMVETCSKICMSDGARLLAPVVRQNILDNHTYVHRVKQLLNE